MPLASIDHASQRAFAYLGPWLVALLVLLPILVTVQILYNRSREPQHGTADLPCTADRPPVNGVVSYYGGLRWRKRGIGAINPRGPMARLDIGFDGVAVGPTFRWQSWGTPLWWFRNSDVRAENAGWALRLVINDTREILFEPTLPSIAKILKAMELHGIRTDPSERLAPYFKLW